MTIGYLEEFIDDNKVLVEAEDFDAILERQDRILRAREERRAGKGAGVGKRGAVNGVVNGNGKRTLQEEEERKKVEIGREEERVVEMAGGEGVLAS